MKRIGRYSFIFILLCLPCALLAQFSPKTDQIALAIYALEYEKARSLIEQEPSAQLKAYFEHHLLFVQTFIEQTPASVEQFHFLSKTIENVVLARPADNYSHYFLAHLYLERSLIHILQEKFQPAVGELRKSSRYVRLQQAQKVVCLPNQGLDGLFLTAFSAVPKQYKWATNILGLKGDLTKGLKAIEAASDPKQAGSLTFLISRYFIARNLLNDFDKSKFVADALLSRQTDHLLFTYFKAHNTIDRKANDEALTLMEGFLKKYPKKPYARLPYFYYQIGRSYFFKLQYDSAIRHFDQFLSIFKGTVFRTDALYKKALALQLSGKSADARACFQTVLKQPAGGFDEDVYARKQAQICLNKPNDEATISFLKARYLYDGGYFDRATALLKTLSAKTLTADQKTEWHYRSGRIAEAKGQNDEAIAQYAKAAAQPAQAALWMKAYALYYQGQLLEKKGRVTEARPLYEAILNLDGYDYQKGLEQKAKAALK